MLTNVFNIYAIDTEVTRLDNWRDSHKVAQLLSMHCDTPSQIFAEAKLLYSPPHTVPPNNGRAVRRSEFNALVTYDHRGHFAISSVTGGATRSEYSGKASA